MNANKFVSIIEKICLNEDLNTFDPYDVWSLNLGLEIKKIYFKNRLMGIIPAGLVSIFDLFINNKNRFFYSKKEYPIVRAQAGLALINIYIQHNDEKYLKFAKLHIDWLLEHFSRDYTGLSWGIGFEIVIDSETTYEKNTPYSTVTPYVLELFDAYYKLSKNDKIKESILDIYLFYEKEIQIMKETNDILITSYGPFKDRIVTNSVSYTMYAYSIFLQYSEDKAYIENKIVKMYNFLKSVQKNNGSWSYSPSNSSTFTDCFHTCFIIKNIYKTSLVINLSQATNVIQRGYQLIKESFYDKNNGLYFRFITKNKPNLISFDLYDNSEVLNLAILLKDEYTVNSLGEKIFANFFEGSDIYSAIDIFGRKKNKNMLRWAVMPLMLTLSRL